MNQTERLAPQHVTYLGQHEEATAMWPECARRMENQRAHCGPRSESVVTPSPNKRTWKNTTPLSILVGTCQEFHGQNLPTINRGCTQGEANQSRGIHHTSRHSTWPCPGFHAITFKLRTGDLFSLVDNNLLPILYRSHRRHRSECNHTHKNQSQK